MHTTASNPNSTAYNSYTQQFATLANVTTASLLSTVSSNNIQFDSNEAIFNSSHNSQFHSNSQFYEQIPPQVIANTNISNTDEDPLRQSKRGRPPLTQEVKDKRAADKEAAKSEKAAKKSRKI